MKKQFTLTLIISLISSIGFAKIWRVNNNAGITADFTTLQAAHDGASAGDTVYLESSPTSYGGLNCTKKLAIIGTGFFLDQNPDLQAFSLPSQAGAITLNTGSAGSSVEGLSLNGSALNIYSNDVVVRRNNLGGTGNGIPDYYVGAVNIYNGASNVLITQNFFIQVGNNSTSTGILISNNLLAANGYGGDATGEACVSLTSNSVAIIKNNVIRRGILRCYNSNLTNNIIFKGSLDGTGNLSSNNIGNATQFGSANSNQQNVDMTTVFVMAGSTDGYFKLKTGSPAIGAGYGSTAQNPVDAGIYGGSTPYMLSGIPAIPSIYFFSNKPVGSNSDPIDVQIKVRSNN